MSGTRAPKTIVVYDITGQTDYTIPFEYLARKFVVVTLIGQDRKVLTLNTDYRFTTKTTIGLSDTNPVGYDKIEIRRFTSATDRLVDFHDGSILRAYDLNLSQIQTLHVAEEARDLAGDSLAVDDNGDLDARGRKIVNLGDAENDGDAVNLGQLKEFDNSTFNNAQLAKASANAAKVSETKAKVSENRAVIAETRAVASAGTAVQAAMDANASKEAAEDAEQVVVPLVPIVEKASQEATKAAADAAQAVQDVKDLGAVPIGSIFPFVKTIPAGFLACDGSTFSKDEYPDLYKYLGSTTLPDMRGRYLKMSNDLASIYQKFPALIPALLHDVDISHTHTASSTFTGNALPTHQHNGDTKWSITPSDREWFMHYGHVATSGTLAALVAGSRSDNQVIGKTQGNSAGTPSGNVTTSVSALTNIIRQTTNMRLQNSNPDIQIGNALEVKHMTVVYAIKAAGRIAEEGLMEVTQIKADVAAVSGRVGVLEQAETKRGLHTLWSGSLGIETSNQITLSDSILNYDMIVFETILYEGGRPIINDSRIFTPASLRSGRYNLIAMQASSASPANDSRAYIHSDSNMTTLMTFSRDVGRQPVYLNAVKGIKY